MPLGDDVRFVKHEASHLERMIAASSLIVVRGKAGAVTRFQRRAGRPQGMPKIQGDPKMGHHWVAVINNSQLLRDQQNGRVAQFPDFESAYLAVMTMTAADGRLLSLVPALE